MPKKKKTREHKILADTRRTVANQSLYTFTSELSKSPKKQAVDSIKYPTATISTTSYQYLAGDLRKTFLFTLFIIIVALVLFYFTKGV